MDANRMKKAAEWFYGNIFRDEAIRPRAAQPVQRVPSIILTARSLEKDPWQSREVIFMKQAKLLAAYEDDYAYEGHVVRYYPTYQSLTDQELRGYFAWRTRLRKGDIHKTSLSFAFLYVYELLNQIGVSDPMDGYRKLTAFRDAYGRLDSSIFAYLDRWLVDYVVYYSLDPNLLADTPQVVFDRSVTVLEHIRDQAPDKVLYAVKQLAPRWLDRSRFYAEHRDDCDAVIFRVLGRMTDHYARCKRGFVEQYFGTCGEYQVRLFDTAVFCDPLKVRNTEYAVDERCVYRCKNGLWTVRKHPIPPRPNARLDNLLKTIDALMREAYGDRHPIKCELDTKWVLKLIREEIQSLLAEKKAAEAKKITIDFGKLAQIRRDAAITRDKLTVEEELEEEVPEVTEEAPPAPPGTDSPLDPAEYRLMQCLLYGRDLGWVQTGGYILSVLLDSINDKLYDIFLDTVVDDTPAPVEDYIDDLKEMVHP